MSPWSTGTPALIKKDTAEKKTQRFLKKGFEIYFKNYLLITTATCNVKIWVN